MPDPFYEFGPVAVTEYAGPAVLGAGTTDHRMIQIDDGDTIVKLKRADAIAVAVSILVHCNACDAVLEAANRLVERPFAADAAELISEALGHHISSVQLRAPELEEPAPCCSEIDSGSGLHAVDCERRCGAEACYESAAELVHWPGKPIRFCEMHVERAKEIAKAMGFDLSTSPLEAPEPHGARRGL
jgi:hypothetical protein